MNIAERFVEDLEHVGVERIWGLSGDSLNALTEALRQSDIEWMHVRHEEVAAFAAGAEADMTGDLAVVAGSCGPGNLHFINGLFDAHRSRVPVLAIASHIPSEEIGGGYFQETHPQELFRECSTYCEMIQHPDQMPWVLENAMRAAVENRGVAVVVVPGDIFFEDAPERRASAPIKRTSSHVVPSAEGLAAAADLLNASKKTTILAGAGVAGSREQVLELAGHLQAPIVHALRGKEHIGYDNEFDVGMTGLLGMSSGYRAMTKCDTLLILGSDLPYRQFYPEDAKVIQVDVRGEQLGRRTPIDVGLRGDVGDTAEALMPLLKGKRSAKHRKDSCEHYQKTRKDLDKLADGGGGNGPVHPQYLMKLVSDLASDGAVFTVDVGTPVIWASRYLEMNGKRRLLGSFVHGSMASAMPQAIGAQAVDRNRQVIALAGDGGLAMLMGDLITIKEHDLNVKIIVFDNSSYAFVEQEMKAAGLINKTTELENPDFAQVANAIGITGYNVETAKELKRTLTKALNEPGPALLNVRTARQELSIPPNITAAQAKGFSLWAMRTVLAGRGDELIDLAETNLLQRVLR